MKSLLLCFACLAASLIGAAGPAGKTAVRPGLPENVERRAVRTFSDGVRLAGDLGLPTSLQPGQPRSPRHQDHL